MNIDGQLSRGRLKKSWMDCVNNDMRIKGVSMEMTMIEENGRRKHVVPTPLSGIGGKMMMILRQKMTPTFGASCKIWSDRVTRFDILANYHFYRYHHTSICPHEI
jgi:hypothetical protein